MLLANLAEKKKAQAKAPAKTTESSGYTVEIPDYPMAATFAEAEAEVTQVPVTITDDGTWQDETQFDGDSFYRSSWLCSAAEVGMGNWRGRLRQFTNIDERDPMDVLNDEEFVGFHAARH